jgi:hypothetical protein
MSNKEKEKRVDAVIAQLKLTHIANNLIGNSLIRGTHTQRKDLVTHVQDCRAESAKEYRLQWNW